MTDLCSTNDSRGDESVAKEQIYCARNRPLRSEPTGQLRRMLIFSSDRTRK